MRGPAFAEQVTDVPDFGLNCACNAYMSQDGKQSGTLERINTEFGLDPTLKLVPHCVNKACQVMS
jgi:hypothetical protein